LLRRLVSDLRLVVKVYPDVRSIARRMFVTNSLDGIVAALGVNVGGYTGGDPTALASSIIGGGVAMGVVSGMIGVYLSERAERLRELRELEKMVAHDLQGSVYWRAAQVIPLYIALWSGLGVLLFPVLIALPHLLAARGLLGVEPAFWASIGVGLASMAWLGDYLARVSGEDRVRSVARVLAMGLAAIVLARLLRFVVG